MPDIRRLVHRVADALGSSATPDRVEAVVQAVLDEVPGTFPSAGPAAHAEPGERAIVTAYGMDAPGILAAITQAVSDAGANIQDVSQKILQDYFTLIMITDVTTMRSSMAELQQRLAEVGERLGVRVVVQHEDLFTAMHRP